MQPEIRIYIDGQLDVKATYIPVVKKKLADAGNGLCDWMMALYN